MKLFELFATLGLDTSGFDGGVKKAANQGKELSKSLTKSLGGAGKAFASGASAVMDKTQGLLKGMGAGLATATAGFAKLSASALEGFGRLEQNVGGIETLFGGAYGTVYKNAQKAFETAGMDANTYMQTVTSFSASLLQSLGGDTLKAAESADMAVQDMSDNANKFGTNIQSIQDAYQGFAKQNYTMLDNLKLGYGGTKTEMERLLADASTLTGKEYDISNLNDVFEAIHAIQTELGITGTTSKEASSTIEGSAASMKAAWKNMLSGAGTAKQLSDAVKTYAKNASTALKTILPRLAESITAIVDELGPEIPAIMEEMLPSVLGGATSLLRGLFMALPGIINGLTASIPTMTDGLKNIFSELLGGNKNFVGAATELFRGLLSGFNELVPQIAAMVGDIAPAILTGILEYKGSLLIAGLKILQEILAGLASDPQAITDAVSGVITDISTWLATPGNLSGLVTNALAIVKAIAEGFTTEEAQAEMKKAFEALLGLFTSDSETIADVSNSIGTAVGNIKLFITDVVQWFINNQEAVSQIIGIIAGIWVALNPGAAVVVGAIAAVTLIATNWGAIKTAVNAAWEAISGFFAETLPGWWIDGVVTPVTNAWNTVTSAINDAITAIRAFFGISSSGGDLSDAINNPVSPGYNPADYITPRSGYATGLGNVPFDNFPARLHEGEAVLTKSQAREWRSGGRGAAIDYSAIGSAVAQAVASALSGVSVNMSGEKVGNIVTDRVSKNIQQATWEARYV